MTGKIQGGRIENVGTTNLFPEPYNDPGTLRAIGVIDWVEVIDATGRAFSMRYRKGSVYVVEQDGGRTLKIFADDPESSTTEGADHDD